MKMSQTTKTKLTQHSLILFQCISLANDDMIILPEKLFKMAKIWEKHKDLPTDIQIKKYNIEMEYVIHTRAHIYIHTHIHMHT